MENFGLAFGVVLGIGIFFGMILIYTVITTLQICEPSEVMIISGRSSDCMGRTVGYSPRQGWAIKWPVIEKVYKMDLRNMTIAVTVKDAYSKEGVPLTVEGVANLKVCGRQPVLHNAVERFMGMPQQYIMRIARETLEGNLRGVLATMTPEEVNHDKMKFAQNLIVEATKDLQRLGLELDNLKIQSIRDDEGYLDCLGRKKQAAQRLENRTAEEENRSAAGVRQAENRKEQTLSELENEMKVVEANATTRIADAQTRREAVVARERARVAKAIAKASAEIDVYKATIEQVQHQLEADVLQPAEAAKEKALAEARAAVAPIREGMVATARMLDRVADAWTAAGPSAREIFRMQKIDGYLDTMLRTLPEVSLDRLTILGSGANGANGRGPDGGGGSWASRAVGTNEELKAALGVDLAGLLPAIAGRLAGENGGGQPEAAAPARSAEPARQASPSEPEARPAPEPRAVVAREESPQLPPSAIRFLSRIQSEKAART